MPLRREKSDEGSKFLRLRFTKREEKHPVNKEKGGYKCANRENGGTRHYVIVSPTKNKQHFIEDLR